MSTSFKLLGCLTILATLLAIAWMSWTANDDAYDRQKADIDAGRWP